MTTARRAKRPSTTKRSTLTDTDRELLRYLANHADLLDITTPGEVDGKAVTFHDPSGTAKRGRFRGQPMRWLLVPIDERMLARLAAFEADREDLEANGDDEDGGEVEPNVVHPAHGYRPEGVAEAMTVTEWRAVR